MRLLRTPYPYSDELPHGYIVRLAADNGLDGSHQLYRMITTKPVFAMRNLSLSDTAKAISALSRITNISQRELEGLIVRDGQLQSLKRTLNAVEVNNGQSFGMSMPYSIKICPDCLGEVPYWRRTWSVRALTTCQVHKKLLIDTCPKCGLQIAKNGKSISQCVCGFEYHNAKAYSVGADEMLLDQFIYLKCGEYSNVERGDKYNDVYSILRKHSLIELITIMTFLANQYLGRADVLGNRIYMQNNIVSLNKLFSDIINVFYRWPSGFYSYLDNIRTLPRKRCAKRGLSHDFGNSLRHFYGLFNIDAFAYFRKAFEEYLISHGVDYEYVCGGKNGIFRQVSRKYGYIVLEEAQQMLKLTSRTVTKLIEHKVLDGIVAINHGKKWVMVKRSSVESYLERVGQLITIREAARQLGLSRSTISKLIKRGHLTICKDVRRFSTTRKGIKADSVTRLIVRIAEQAGGSCVEQTRDVITFSAAAKRFSKIYVDTGGFIDLILEGKIGPVKRVDQYGHTIFCFARRDVDDCYEALLNEMYPGTVSVEISTRLLNLTWQTLMTLCRKRYIKHQHVSLKKLRLVRINEASMLRYQREHIPVTELKSSCKMGSRKIKCYLRGLGILPLQLGPNRTCIYRRSEIAAVKL